jgi:peptidoglycan/xylan/chitin deacetylase (PgdA/CDA1 family)
VPGHTADHHPDAVAAILAGGHEVGHHGYLHRSSETLDVSGQRAELEQGLTALGRHGVRPLGYRSPGWELTPDTLGMLAELGFSYDSVRRQERRSPGDWTGSPAAGRHR